MNAVSFLDCRSQSKPLLHTMRSCLCNHLHPTLCCMLVYACLLHLVLVTQPPRSTQPRQDIHKACTFQAGEPTSTALSASPPHSARAFLQSIMPAPVFVRRAFTSAALMPAVGVEGTHSMAQHGSAGGNQLTCKTWVPGGLHRYGHTWATRAGRIGEQTKAAAT